MKKYHYSFLTIFLTIIMFPIIYFKSKKVFQKLQPICHDYQREGIDPKHNLEMNSFEQHQVDLVEMKLPKSFLNKQEIIEANLNTKNGDISYLKIINPRSNKWVIGLHGWTENKYLALRLVEHFYNEGYNIITFDSFAHGKTYGAKTDFGLSAIPIMDELIEQLMQNEQVDSLGLIGNSMGASTAILYSQVGKHKSQVNWVVADCGFSDLKTFYRHFSEFGPNKNKWWMVGYRILNRFSKNTGVDQKKYNLLKKMDQNSDIPIFFIHSQEDSWVPSWNSQEMFNQKIKYEPNQISKVWFVEKGEHFWTISNYYDEYTTKTLEFARKHDNLN